jgi:hypothetical protein
MNSIRALIRGPLTAEEERCVAGLEAWATAYALPGGCAERMVDEVYADQPEVVSVLTGTVVARHGADKTAWRKLEGAMEALYRERHVVFTAVYPRGNTIAIEARIEQVLHDGTRRGWPFAVFLTFDDAGRIVTDHTYMQPPPTQKMFDDAAKAAQTANSRGSNA